MITERHIRTLRRGDGVVETYVTYQFDPTLPVVFETPLRRGMKTWRVTTVTAWEDRVTVYVVPRTTEHTDHVRGRARTFTGAELPRDVLAKLLRLVACYPAP